MRVTNLDLYRFLAWRRLSLDLSEKISVFVGANGVGKSSILDAVRVLVSKTARGRPKGDLGPLSTWGEKPFKLEGTVGVFDDEGDFLSARIRRTATTLSVIDEEGTATALKEGDLVGKLTRFPGAVEAVFDLWKAARMSPEDRRALVLTICKDRVRPVTDELLFEMGLTDNRVRAKALSGAWHLAAKEAADLRLATEANRTAANGPVYDPELPGGLRASEVDDESLGLARQNLAELVAEHNALGEKIGTLKERSRNGSGEDDDPAGELAELRRDLAGKDLEGMIRTAAEISARLEGLRTMPDGLAAQLKIARQLEESAEKEATAAREAFDDASQPADSFTCRRCGHQVAHECPALPTGETLAELRKASDAAEQTRFQAVHRVEVLVKEKEKVERELAGFKEDLGRYTEAIAEYERQEARAKKLAGRVAEKEERDSAAEDLAGEISAAAIRKRELAGRIEQGRAMIAHVDAYRAAASEGEGAAEKRARLEERIESLRAQEDLCRQDREGNIPSRLVAELVDPIRELLAGWTRSSLFSTEMGLAQEAPRQIVGVDIEEDFSLVVIDSEGERHQVDTANASAEWRVGFVFAAAVAKLSGLRFLPVDEITYLDRTNRSGLVAALLDLADDFDQVLICAALTGEVVQPATPDVRFYFLTPAGAERLQDGQVIDAS